MTKNSTGWGWVFFFPIRPLLGLLPVLEALERYGISCLTTVKFEQRYKAAKLKSKITAT